MVLVLHLSTKQIAPPHKGLPGVIKLRCQNELALLWEREAHVFNSVWLKCSASERRGWILESSMRKNVIEQTLIDHSVPGFLL